MISYQHTQYNKAYNNKRQFLDAHDASPAMEHWGTCTSRLTTISFLVHFEVNLTANYPNIV